MLTLTKTAVIGRPASNLPGASWFSLTCKCRKNKVTSKISPQIICKGKLFRENRTSARLDRLFCRGQAEMLQPDQILRWVSLSQLRKSLKSIWMTSSRRFPSSRCTSAALSSLLCCKSTGCRLPNHCLSPLAGFMSEMLVHNLHLA